MPAPSLSPWYLVGLSKAACLLCARKLFTKEITLIKGIKIAGKDGKHFVERSVDTRGNGAVNKIGGDRHTERSSQATAGQCRSSWDRQVARMALADVEP